MKLNMIYFRLAALAVVASSILAGIFIFQRFNSQSLWLSVPFLLAYIYISITLGITIINNWRRSEPSRSPVAHGDEPIVAVIIPTYNEPIAIIRKTVQSVIDQDYPNDRVLIVVSDDGHRSEVSRMVDSFAAQGLWIVFNDPIKHGQNKAGNLNDAFAKLRAYYPDIQFVETRDCDDLVGDPQFLRETVGVLMNNQELAFVQTIKDARVAPGDPFGNRETPFYRAIMASRHDANAVFPCGSGVIYRAEAVDDLGGFDTVGSVEDLRTGYRLLQLGWSSAYLPIVGAMGQIAPEDVQNVRKQRYTWAVDTMSMLLYDNPLTAPNLSFRQRLQFVELGTFYGLSFVMLFFTLLPAAVLLTGTYPVIATFFESFVLIGIYVITIELLLVALMAPEKLEEIWRARQMWVSLAPIYAQACIDAVKFPPGKKPTYKVTRKEHKYAFYFRDTLGAWALTGILVISVGFHLTTKPHLLLAADFGSLAWAGYFVLSLSMMTMGSLRGTIASKIGFAVEKFLHVTGTARAVRRLAFIGILGLILLSVAVSFADAQAATPEPCNAINPVHCDSGAPQLPIDTLSES